jgi:hypothetical protein
MRGNPDRYGILLARSDGPEEERLQQLMLYALTDNTQRGFGIIGKLGTRKVICAIDGSEIHSDLEKLRRLKFVAIGRRQGKWLMYHITEMALAAMHMPNDVRIGAIKCAKRYSGGRKLFPFHLNEYKSVAWEVGNWETPGAINGGLEQEASPRSAP